MSFTVLCVFFKRHNVFSFMSFFCICTQLSAHFCLIICPDISDSSHSESLSSFIKLSNGSLQSKFIRTFPVEIYVFLILTCGSIDSYLSTYPTHAKVCLLVVKVYFWGGGLLLNVLEQSCSLLQYFFVCSNVTQDITTFPF